jgi:hypothetical protein
MPDVVLVRPRKRDLEVRLSMRSAANVSASSSVRNPFGVMDVPQPDDAEVQAFAAHTVLSGAADDANAHAWASLQQEVDGIEGRWSSRWNGGADPSIPDDAADKWKVGQAELRLVNDRVYLLFDWHEGARRGLIEARRETPTWLVGKYINLTSPAIMRPWVGLIVDARRIDGRWTSGRLDFRR